MNTRLGRLAGLVCLVYGHAVLATTIVSLEDGPYVCPPPPGTCAWGNQGMPGPADTAVVAHMVSLSTAAATLQLGTFNLVNGGTFGIYGGSRLQFGGGTWSGGALDSCCSGGGTWNNVGQLNITGNPIPANRGILENNGTLRAAPGSQLIWDQGNGGGLFANLTTTATPAVVLLDDTGRISGNLTFANEGIVRKTGNGTSTVDFLLRNMGTSLIYPGLIDVQAGTLAFADTGSYQSRLVSEGSIIQVAAGAVLAIRDGGELRLVPDGPFNQIYTTSGSGPGRVRLETGGALYGANPLGDSSVPAVMNFAPGLFEWTGGAITGAHVRNTGEITIAGPDDKAFDGVIFSSTGLIRLTAPRVRNGGIVTILPLGAFEASNDTEILGYGNSRLIVDGVLRKVAGPGTLKIDNLFEFAGSGTLSINGGHLLTNDASLTNLGSFDGTIELLNNAAIDLVNPGETVVIKETAKLTGVGSVNAGTLDQRGTFEPGLPFGAVAVSGLLLQNGTNPSPVTRINIGGPLAVTQSAQIQVAGNLRPYGVLRVNFRDGYAPPAGATFDLITVGGTLTDTLAQYQVIIEGLAPGFLYTLTFSPTNSVRLTAVNQVPSLADLVFRDGFE